MNLEKGWLERESEFEKRAELQRISISQNGNVWRLHYQRISMQNNLNWKSLTDLKVFSGGGRVQALESLLSNIYNISILVISPMLVEAGTILRRENIDKMHFYTFDQEQNSIKNCYEIHLVVKQAPKLQATLPSPKLRPTDLITDGGEV